MFKNISFLIKKVHAKIYQVACFIVCIFIYFLQIKEHNISKKILDKITNISCSIENIDEEEQIIHNTMSIELIDILERIKHNILLNTEQELQLESYVFASNVEKLILDLNKQGHKFEALSIVPNRQPSTNWRIDNTSASMNIFNHQSEEMKKTILDRKNYTRKQTKYNNVIRIIDYKDSNVKNFDIYKKNIEEHRLISIKHKKQFEHGLGYGIYWIIKFKDNDNFYILSSPLSFQADDSLNTQSNYSQRVFYKLSHNNFKRTAFYKYLSLRIPANTLDSFIR